MNTQSGRIDKIASVVADEHLGRTAENLAEKMRNLKQLTGRSAWEYVVTVEGNVIHLKATFRLPFGHISGAGVGMATYVGELEKAADRNGLMAYVQAALNRGGYAVESVDVDAYADEVNDAAYGEIEIIVTTLTDAKKASTEVEKAFCAFVNKKGFQCHKGWRVASVVAHRIDKIAEVIAGEMIESDRFDDPDFWDDEE